MHPTPDVAGPGQESVWSYPRPPRLERSTAHVVVRLGDRVVADTRRAHRVLETSHPPTWYLPPDDCDESVFRPAEGASYCEWKGSAVYWDVVTAEQTVTGAVWSYPNPTAGFAAIRDHRAFYASRFDCTVDGERAQPQPGGFYGGWITPDVVGPFKGVPGSSGW